MRNFHLLLILIILFSCKDSSNEKIVDRSQNITPKDIPRKDEVYIWIEDSLESFSTNLRIEEFQDKPDLIGLGKDSQRQSITIPTKNDLTLTGIHLIEGFRYDIVLNRGDSVKIRIEDFQISSDASIKIPFFNITNSDRKFSEVNFDYLLYKKNIHSGSKYMDSTESFNPLKWNSRNIYLDAIELLDSLKRINEISDSFYDQAKENQLYKYLLSQAREDNLKIIDSTNLVMTHDEKFKIIDPNQNLSSDYISFLRGLIDHKYFNNNRRIPNSQKFDFLINNNSFLNNELKIQVLDSYLKSIYFQEKEKFKDYVVRFIKINSSQELNTKWENLLQSHSRNRERLNTINRNIALLTNLVNDNQLTFEEILKEQNGKVVLVDFWASWCAPCRMEMPALKKLEEKFDSDKFQIVEISIDQDYQAWERASKLENLYDEKHSYHISNWKNSNLHKTYNIETIPRYILFGKNGKVINEDAPRPSTSKLFDLIKASI